MTHHNYELEKYLALVKKADSLYRAAERTKAGNRPKKSSIFKLPRHWLSLDTKGISYRKAELAYEKALEYLDEVWPSVVHLLDRRFLGWSESDASPDPWGVPRQVNSKSKFAKR